MKQTFRQHWLALSVVILVSAVVAACGQITEGEMSQQEPGNAAGLQHRASLTAENVCADASDPACTPSGAHARHGSYQCVECHAVAGRLAFKIGGAAYGQDWVSTKPRPSFDAAGKTCSNVACHSVPSGTFEYAFQAGDGGTDYRVATYGGLSQVTPGWYATGTTCTGCHGNPPTRNGVQFYGWHTGSHANRTRTSTYNQCQFCHPDAWSTNATATGLCKPTATDPAPTNCAGAARHRDGIVDVTPVWQSSCFFCH